MRFFNLWLLVRYWLWNVIIFLLVLCIFVSFGKIKRVKRESKLFGLGKFYCLEIVIYYNLGDGLESKTIFCIIIRIGV